MKEKENSVQESRSYFHRLDEMEKQVFVKISTSEGSLVKGDKIYVGLVHKARGSGSQPHRHPFEQFNYVLNGRLKACVDGQEQIVSAGGLIHIPANTLHTIVATPEEDAYFLMVKEVTPMGVAGIPEDPEASAPRYE